MMRSEGPPDPDLEAAAAGVTARGACPDDDRLLAFYRGGVGAAEEETLRDHLASCAGCVARAHDARDFVETVDPAVSWVPDRPAVPGRSAAPRRLAAVWLGLAAAAAAVAVTGLWSLRRPAITPPADGVPPIAWSDVAVRPAPYLPAEPPANPGDDLVYRDGGPGDPFAAAMEPYAAGDFVAAETALESLVAAGPPDPRARFYLAVTRLLNGRAEDARRDLEALERSGAAHDRGGVAWYLALAFLKTGRAADARERLEAIATGGGERAAEARTLLERLQREAGR